MTDLSDEQLAEFESVVERAGGERLRYEFEHVGLNPQGRIVGPTPDVEAAVQLLRWAPWALRALRDAQAENEALRAQAGRHGACIGCNYNDGPDEFCPQHGRTYDDLLGILDKVASERDPLRAENADLRDRIAAVQQVVDDASPFGPNYDKIRAALAAPTGHAETEVHR